MICLQPLRRGPCHSSDSFKTSGKLTAKVLVILPDFDVESCMMEAISLMQSPPASLARLSWLTWQHCPSHPIHSCVTSLAQNRSWSRPRHMPAAQAARVRCTDLQRPRAACHAYQEPTWLQAPPEPPSESLETDQRQSEHQQQLQAARAAIREQQLAGVAEPDEAVHTRASLELKGHHPA